MISDTRASQSPASTASTAFGAASRSLSFLDDITRALTREFATVHPSDLVDRCVREAFGCFHGAQIEAYLPVLVHKLAREELARHASDARRQQQTDGR